MTDFTKKQNNQTILLFLIPLMFSGVFQSVYALVNSAVVGRVISHEAVAIIGACSTMNTLISHLFGGMSAGMAVYFGRCIGTGDAKTVGRAFRGAEFCMLALSALALVAAAFPGYPARAANVPEAIFPEACLYLRFLFAGAFFVGMKGLLIGLVQGFGDSKMVSVLSMASVVLQTLLVLLLVGGLHMGVEGSALAVIFNNLICCLILAYYYRRKYINMVPSVHPGDIDGHTWGELVYNAVAKSSMMLIIWVGSFVFSRQVNNLPSELIAINTYARSINTVFVEVVSAFGTAATVMLGQNFGTDTKDKKQRYPMMVYYARRLFTGAILASLLVTLLFGAFGRFIFAFIAGVSPAETMASLGALELGIFGLGYPGLAILLVSRWGLQAMGRYRIQPVLGIIETIVNVVAARFVVDIGIAAIGWCSFFKWVLPGIAAGSVFLIVMIREREMAKQDEH